MVSTLRFVPSDRRALLASSAGAVAGVLLSHAVANLAVGGGSMHMAMHGNASMPMGAGRAATSWYSFGNGHVAGLFGVGIGLAILAGTLQCLSGWRSARGHERPSRRRAGAIVASVMLAQVALCVGLQALGGVGHGLDPFHHLTAVGFGTGVAVQVVVSVIVALLLTLFERIGYFAARRRRVERRRTTAPCPNGVVLRVRLDFTGWGRSPPRVTSI